MPQRLRVYDLRTGPLPGLLGLCQSDVLGLCSYLNRAEPRMVMAKEAGQEGWWGTFAEIKFLIQNTINTTSGLCFPRSAHITLPRNVARIEAMTICDTPVFVQNQLFEYLTYGNGRVPKHFRCSWSLFPVSTYTRNNVATFLDITNPPQFIRVVTTDPADNGKRILFQGTDPTNTQIYSQDGFNRAQGQFVVFGQPFAQATIPMNNISAIQKDVTNSIVQIYQVDPTTGTQVLISTMDPTETTASYRRYIIYPLPLNCCFGCNTSLCLGPPPATPQTIPQTISVTAFCKMDMLRLSADTDYTLIQNQEAFIEESQSVRYQEMDVPNKAQMMQEHHISAIRLLNGELAHYVGIEQPAVGFAPFGSARLFRRRIGSLV